MELPIELGLEEVGDVPHTARLLGQLERLQGEGGYADEPESARMRELHAVAHVLAHAQGALEGAEAGIHPHQAVELLPDHERARRVPNDAARTVEERQARLVAIGASRRGASASDMEAALARLGLTATVQSVTRSEADAEGAPADAVFQLAVTAPADEQTPARRRAAVELLRRALPVLQYGHRHHASPDEMLVVDVGPTWDDPSAVLGTCALEAATGTTQTRAPSRLKGYSALSRLTARDLNALQRQMLLSACSATNDLRHANGQERFLAFAVHLPSASSATIDTMDARYRLGRVVMLYGTDATDRRPGQAGDTDLNGQDYVERLWYTGDGTSAYDLAVGATAHFAASSSSITITNDSGGTLTFVGFLEMSGDARYGAGGIPPHTLTDFVDGVSLDAAGLSQSWWSAMLATVGLRRGSGGGITFWTGMTPTTCGGVSRQMVLAQTVQPGSGANTFVMDSSVDWRGRLLFVEFAVAGLPVSGYVGFPGGPSDILFSSFPTVCTVMGWTGDGVTPGSASALDYHIPLENGLRLAARDSDGALIVEHSSSWVGTDEQMSAILIVHGTDPLLDASAVPNPTAAVDGNPIVAEQLNGLQDAGMLTQGRAIEPAPGETPVDVDAMPLGPAVRGNPRIPIAFSVSRRDGRRDQPRFERRQPVAGRLRRVFAVAILDATAYVLDDVEDWRDRFLVGWCAFSASDIRPEEAADDDIASGTASQTRLATYTGSGRPAGTIVSGQYHLAIFGGDLFLYARDTDGALMIRNDTGGTRYVVGWLEAGFPLGPRSA